MFPPIKPHCSIILWHKNLNLVCNDTLELLKVKFKQKVFTSCSHYCFSSEIKIYKEEHTALKNLKGPSVVVMDRHDYIKWVNEMLYDSSKFEEVDIKPGTEIKFLLQEEDGLTASLKCAKKPKSNQLHKVLYLLRVS